MNNKLLAVIAFGATGSLVSCSDTQSDSSSDSTGYGAAAGFAAAGGFNTGTGGAAPAAGGFSPGSGRVTGAGGIIPGSGGAPGGAPGAGGVIGSGGVIDTGGTSASGGRASGGTVGAGGATAVVGPCDIYESGGTPCVAAHSTVRALFGTYDGKLYQVRRSSDNTTQDIGTLTAGGFADAGAQNAFCSNTKCVITFVYDQSGKGNHLEYQGAGSSVGGRDDPASATGESLTISGHKVYSLYINPGNSYWRDGSRSGIPTGSAPEGLYIVTSGVHVNGGCCFDYGNSETDRKADGAGAMDAINFSTQCWFGGCSGTGPWVQADIEYGLYSGGSQSWNANQKAFPNKYVTAMLKNNGTTTFALKGANAQSGALSSLYDGKLPNGYSPMKKQGAIVLGSGGDCCATNRNQSLGTFYEGAIVSGYPTSAIDDSIQNNIVAAGYGG
jgi:hypothetical protein